MSRSPTYWQQQQLNNNSTDPSSIAERRDQHCPIYIFTFSCFIFGCLAFASLFISSF